MNSFSNRDLFKSLNNKLNGNSASSMSFTGMWNGGFAGLSASGVADLKLALNRYIMQLEEDVMSQNFYHLVDDSFGVKNREAVYDYIDSLKKIICAYIDMLKINIKDLDMVYNTYIEETNALADRLFNKASDISFDVKKLRESVNINL